MRIVTPHGIILEEAYFRIEYFSHQVKNQETIFTGNFYASEEAKDSGAMGITDISFASGTNTIIPDGNIREQLYNFIKSEAAKIGDPNHSEVNMSYSIFKEAVDC